MKRIGWITKGVVHCVSRSLFMIVFLMANHGASANSLIRHLPASRGQTYFVDFLARPTKYGVDHAFIQIGWVSDKGTDQVEATIGFYPIDYPQINFSTSLFNARGVITKMPEDTPSFATIHHRIRVDQLTFTRALAHSRRMRREWRKYDLIARNCNAVIIEYADWLGLEVPHTPLDQSTNIIRSLIDRNPDRLYKSWRLRYFH